MKMKRDKISFDDLIALRDEIYESECGSSFLVFDGVEYHTDIGYAFEGIDIFFEILERRLL